MTTTQSMMCLRGPHWACSVCAPLKKCSVHNTRCIPTNSLWYTTISQATQMASVCSSGCVGKCKCHVPGPVSVTLGSMGTFTSLTMMYSMLKRAGAATTACGVHVRPGKSPWTIEVLSETRYMSATQSLKCNFHCDAGHGVTGTMEARRIGCTKGGTIIPVTMQPAPSKRVAQFIADMWQLVRLTDAVLQPITDTRQFEGCAARRRDKTMALPHAIGPSAIAWGTLPADELVVHYPPGSRIRASMTQCVWCLSMFSTSERYHQQCAPDAIC